MDCTCTNPWHFVVTDAVGADSGDSADGMHPCRDHSVGQDNAWIASEHSVSVAKVVDRNNNPWVDSVAIASCRIYSSRCFHALSS